jgi:16S rRNA (adenine1518-N6/adenine1519-N6)-dimethyltransferase
MSCLNGLNGKRSMLSIPALLKKYGLFPRKGLGQNFLVEPLHVAKIIEAAALSPTDTVLEIGPGPGTLTRFLAEAAGRVVAVELDSHMVALLRQEYTHLTNLAVVQGDILQVKLEDLIRLKAGDPLPEATTQDNETPPASWRLEPGFKVVANLPYYITSAVLRHVLESPLRPERIVVTVQKEVAQRIVAQPGEMSLLAVSVQFYGQPVLAHRIPAGAFYPPPKVDSAVVRIDTFAAPPVPVTDVAHFFRVVKAGFSQKRKQLKNTLAAGLSRPSPEIIQALAQAGIDPTRRAETLSLAEWGRLAEELNKT